VRGGNAFSRQEISDGRKQEDAAGIKAFDVIIGVFQECQSGSI